MMYTRVSNKPDVLHLKKTRHEKALVAYHCGQGFKKFLTSTVKTTLCPASVITCG